MSMKLVNSCAKRRASTVDYKAAVEATTGLEEAFQWLREMGASRAAKPRRHDARPRRGQRNGRQLLVEVNSETDSWRATPSSSASCATTGPGGNAAAARLNETRAARRSWVATRSRRWTSKAAGDGRRALSARRRASTCDGARSSGRWSRPTHWRGRRGHGGRRRRGLCPLFRLGC